MNIRFGFLTMIMALAAIPLNAQVYKTSTGTVKFYSHTTVEDINATNSTVAAALNTATGAVEFSVSINSFQFKKALMQKHFQENYMESGKFPKSTFKGTVEKNSAVNYKKDGTYSVNVKGKLTIHGQTKDVTIPGKIIVKGGKITLTADGKDFKVKPADYKIKIPANNAAQIAEEIEVSVNCELSKK
ncbi:MAG: YceI family protein [Bacteroidetes bacterium]|nr:YceI family protein [Bacteroidota bacterium]